MCVYLNRYLLGGNNTIRHAFEVEQRAAGVQHVTTIPPHFPIRFGSIVKVMAATLSHKVPLRNLVESESWSDLSSSSANGNCMNVMKEGECILFCC